MPGAKMLYEDVSEGRASATIPIKTRATFELSNPNIQQQLHDRIKLLRQSDFDFVHRAPDGQETLVKFHRDSIKPLNPIHPYEAEIQALRYLRGMLLIQENSTHKSALKSQIAEAYENYIVRTAALPASSEAVAIETHRLAENFAAILQKDMHVSLKKARDQVTMGRDLAVMQETHPAVATITKSGNNVTIEQSEQIKISPEYYQREFESIGNKKWFQAAKKFAGFKSDTENTWLDRFFSQNYESLQKTGMPAPPSARWLPLPANNQVMQTVTATIDQKGELQIKNEFDFVRMGITTAFNIKNINEQERLAKEQLKEIMLGQLDKNLMKFKEQYRQLEPHNFPFIVSYQTLLSPHYLEASFYPKLKDNNAKFVEMAKAAMHELASEYEGKKVDGVRLEFSHTNAAINKVADWLSAKEFEKDQIDREKKWQATSKFISHIVFQHGPQLQMREIEDLNNIAAYIAGKTNTLDLNKLDTYADRIRSGELLQNLEAPLRHEMAIRMQAASALRQLANREAPFDHLTKYQRNLFVAGLENVEMGVQALRLTGCKSARDREGMFTTVVKAMLQNPACMRDWNQLNSGIIKGLNEGHAFRSMIYHLAIVKVSDVHSSFMVQLSNQVQKQIKALKPFAKKLSEFKEKVKALTTTMLFERMEVNPNSISNIDKARPLQLLKSEYVISVNNKFSKENVSNIEKLQHAISIIDGTSDKGVVLETIKATKPFVSFNTYKAILKSLDESTPYQLWRTNNLIDDQYKDAKNTLHQKMRGDHAPKETQGYSVETAPEPPRLKN